MTMAPGQLQTGNIDELKRQLTEQAAKNKDFLVPASLIRFQQGDLHVYKRSGEHALYHPTELFHAQMAAYLQVPKAYYDRLRKDRTLTVKSVDDDMRMTDTPLFDVVMNRHLKEKDEDMRLIRSWDGSARAFLSDSFNLYLDNYDIAECTLSALSALDLPTHKVYRCSLTHENLVIQVLSPRLKAQIKVGDVVQGGFQIANSEVGLRSTELSLFIYRLTCANGATSRSVVKRRHIGRVLEADATGTVYQSDTRKAEADAVLFALRDSITDLLTGEYFKDFVETMLGATEIPLRERKELSDVVEVTRKRFGLSEAEGFEVLSNLQEERDYTLYGLANAITATARETASADRRFELESLGGEVFGLRGRDLVGIAR